ncbi:hypothetical protein ACJX0J_023353, partial [Zea mays]
MRGGEVEYKKINFYNILIIKEDTTANLDVTILSFSLFAQTIAMLGVEIARLAFLFGYMLDEIESALLQGCISYPKLASNNTWAGPRPITLGINTHCRFD